MKKLLFVLIAFAIFGMNLADAQNIPSTAGPGLCDCLPPGWSTVQGGGNSTSTRTNYLSNEIFYTPMLPPIPSGANTFLSMHGGISKAVVNGLVVGKKYKFNYSVISAKTNYLVNGSDHSQYFSDLAYFRIQNVGSAGEWVKHRIDFDEDTDANVWRTAAFEFTAQKTSAEVLFENAGDITPGFVGLDLTVNAVIPCVAGVDQVGIMKPVGEIICPATHLNLITEFFGGIKPSGTDILFFDNPTHSGLPLTNVNVGAGTYYAFYHDPANNCYNTNYSTAKVVVTYKPCADLTPTINIASLNFGGGVTRDFVVNLFENNGSATSGNVSFRITKLGGFNITYPTISGNSAVFGGMANQNSNWTFTENAQFITVTSTVPIPAKGKAVIGFNIKRKPGINAGLTQNMTPTILSGAGGEQNSKNNSIATSASTN